MSELTLDAALRTEFDDQVDTLVARGYPVHAGIGAGEFRARLEPLAGLLGGLPASADGKRTPFAIVVGQGLVPRGRAVETLDLAGKPGYTDMDDDDLASFGPLDGVVELPIGDAYLVADVDVGAEFLNVTPDAALPRIQAAGRSPLTIDEGVALVTQRPELLADHRFSLLGSRCGDRRVPALWVKQGGRPRLGWCFAGAPHTWLGSASCAARVGVAG